MLQDPRALYHIVRAGLELLYFLSSVGLLIVAYRALDQIRVAKQDLATRVKREAAKEASQQLDDWATRIIPLIAELMAAETAVSLQKHSCQMERFDNEELATKSPEDQQHQRNVVAIFQAHPEMKKLSIKVCNMVESSALTFVKGVADEEIAFVPLSTPFCAFVEHSYPIYCGARNTGQLNQWENTVNLYGVWAQRRKAVKLDAQYAALSVELSQAKERGAPIPPMGK